MIDEQDHALFVTTYNPVGNILTNNGTVTAYSTTSDSMIGSVQVGAFPSAMAFSPRADELFVANYYSGGLSIFAVSPFRLLTSLNLTAYALVYDPFDGDVFAATSELNGSVTQIDPMTNAIVNTVRVGGTPDFLLLNPWNGLLYVPCSGFSDGLQAA
ncbi:MAG: hypothetical protein WCB18_01030, partial [Thermoplasmata archaeon]